MSGAQPDCACLRPRECRSSQLSQRPRSFGNWGNWQTVTRDRHEKLCADFWKQFLDHLHQRLNSLTLRRALCAPLLDGPMDGLENPVKKRASHFETRARRIVAITLTRR